MTLLVRILLAFVVAAAFGTQAFAQTDPLPSWNDGAAKAAINEFVHATTDQSSPKFVPPEQRTATFDQIAVSLRRKNFEGGPVLHDRHSNFFSCFHGRSLPRCEEPGPKLEETLSCGAAGWPGETANRRGPARELLRPR
jgi:hypothetical protein